jgi:hypothetical protein
MKMLIAGDAPSLLELDVEDYVQPTNAKPAKVLFALQESQLDVQERGDPHTMEQVILLQPSFF